MTDNKIHPRVQAAAAADEGILATFGARIEQAWQGECEICATVPAALVNAAGFAHGGVSFALLDTACAYALGSLEVRGLTLNANITYVRGAAAGDVLTARVRVESRSRRVATMRGEVHVDVAGEPVLAAHGSFVFQLRAATPAD